MSGGLIACVLFVVGVATGVVSDVRSTEAGALAIASASIAIGWSAFPTVWTSQERLRWVLLSGALLSAAVCDGAAARDRTLASPLALWLEARAPMGRLAEPVQIEGTIVEDASAAEGGVRLIVEINRLAVDGAWRSLPGRVQATVAGALSLERSASWRAGRSVTAPITLRTLDVWRNPGSASVKWQRLHQSFDAAGSIKSGALVVVRPGRWWREAEADARAYVRSVARQFVRPRAAQSAAIVAAILIGDRTGLDPVVQRRLQAAGTYHVIAISGGNVALLTVICFVVTRLMVRSPRAPAIVTMLVVFAYGAMLGDDASIRRAVIAAELYFGLSLAGLIARPVDLLIVVAAIVTAIDPLVAIDVGAWLSFGATLGIIVAAGRIVRALNGRPAPGSRGAVRDTLARLKVAALSLFAATLAAEIALLPIGATVFSRVGVAGLALNFVAIPAMSVVEVGGLIMCLVARAWPWLAGQAAAAVDLGARVLVGSTGLLDVLPALSWRVPPVAVEWALVYYAAWAVAVWTRAARRWRVVGAAIGASIAVVYSAALFPVQARPTPGWLRLTVLDVGQGDALVLQCPTGQALIVDAGGLGEFDVGGRVVTPALWALGIRRLAWLAFTHPDSDHIGGALAVATDLRPREIWEGIPVPKNRDRTALAEDARARGIPWRQLRAGDRLNVADVVIDVLHPPAPDWERQRARNDDSIVLRVSIGDVELLLTGDAGGEFEQAFAREPSIAPIRVLKVGHHGSRSSSSAAFLDAYRPQLALVSVGRGNLFGHPAPEVLARLTALDARVFRTDRDGAIVLETNGRRVHVRTWTGTSWTFERRDVGQE